MKPKTIGRAGGSQEWRALVQGPVSSRDIGSPWDDQRFRRFLNLHLWPRSHVRDSLPACISLQHSVTRISLISVLDGTTLNRNKQEYL